MCKRAALLTLVGAGSVAYALLASRRRLLRLNGKVVLTTGGSRGLGLQMAREFGRQGATVAICARDRSQLERALVDLRARGLPAYSFVFDVSDRAQVATLVETVEKTVGPVEVLVNNAGVIKVGPVAAMTHENFEEAMEVMFWGMLHTSMAVLPFMRARRAGRIVNIASIGGKVSIPHLLPYSCAKFAAVALSDGLRAELSPLGITVTTISPGLMRTGSHLNAEFKGDHDKEYGWFAAGAATSFVSISAERAAREIVRAAIRGTRTKILSVPADVAARMHGIMPGVGSFVLDVINRCLPSRDVLGPTETKKGWEIEKNFRAVWKQLTESGLAAAEDLNEV